MEANPSNWKKTFFLIWTGQSLSLIGSQMVHFAIAWWLTQSTGSAVVLATIAIFGLLPQVFLGPFIGALVDRWNRRLVLILSDSLIAVFTLGLAVLFLTGQIQHWHLYAMALVRGTLGAFHWAAMQASTSLMVPREQLARVAGMNQTLFGVLNIAAPPLGALVVSLLPMGQIMLIDVTTAALAVLPLLVVRIPQPARAPETGGMVTPRMVLRDVAEGFRYLRAWPGMMVILGMATLVNFLLNPTGTLTPLLITRHFEGGAWHLGAIESTWGLGAIAGGLLLSVWGGFRRRIVTSMLSLSLGGLAILMVGLVPPQWFLLALVANAVSGMMNPLINGPLMALVQENIAPEMQGRVFSLIGSLAAAMSPLGMALAAPVADGLGIRVWWWIGGGLTAALGLLVLSIPAVLHVEEQTPPPAPGSIPAAAD
jgi:DHA3 family macrolide efflux protein-like MFS transporter